ncbi:hypothetical protein HispidOSU_021474, partial [Sigmodon hispidus]
CVSPETSAIMATVPTALRQRQMEYDAHVHVLSTYLTSFKNSKQSVLGRIIPGHKLIVSQTLSPKNLKRHRQFTGLEQK